MLSRAVLDSYCSMCRVLPEDDVNQVRQHISAYSVVYSMNQVRQNMCRTIKNKFSFLKEGLPS